MGAVEIKFDLLQAELDLDRAHAAVIVSAYRLRALTGIQ